MHSKYYIPARTATLPYTVDVTPESAGWTEASLKVVELKSMQELALETDDTEVMILPLAGSGTVEADNQAFELSPRASVFDGPADMVYIGTDQRYTLRGEGRLAICGARAKRQLPNRRVAAADVSVELRGTGNCSRQVHNFGTAGVFDADSLIACEVITPGGNWSSYPAHKHDEETPVESALEEIYYFEIASGPRRFPRLRLPQGVRHTGTSHRGARGGPLRRCRPGATRLSRPVGGRARVSHVLPERDGRSRRGTGLEDRRRPRTRLAARHLGRPGRRPPASPASTRSMTWFPKHPCSSRRTPNRPCGSPSPRPPFDSWPTSTSNATANAASSSPAASASSATATWPAWARRCCKPRSRRRRPAPTRHCDMCWAATSRRWCTPPPRMPGRRTGCRHGP